MATVGWSLLACAAPPCFAQAPAAGRLEARFEARKVARTADGSERFSAAASAQAGDVIEYVAHFRNVGSEPVRNVDATLPIPTGAELIPGSARPDPERVSADGLDYGKPPLTRRIQRDGREVVEQVYPREYRSLRWTLGALASGESATYSARLRVRDVREFTASLHSGCSASLMAPECFRGVPATGSPVFP